MSAQGKLLLAIDTSCDETSVAIVDGRRVLANVVYSQVLIHKQWGGVVPSLAKRAHEERIDWVIEEACRKLAQSSMQNLLGSVSVLTRKSGLRTSQVARKFASSHFDRVLNQIDCIAVTQGPGLAIALEVGIRKAKELAQKYDKKLIAVNHMEGHLCSPFVQNKNGNPDVNFQFPMIGFLVSGAHTEIVRWNNHLEYEVIGETLDDAAGEAIDKAARLLLGVGYPGGGAMERIAEEVYNEDKYHFPRPMQKSAALNFSFSGLKTALLYTYRKMSEEEKIRELKFLASSFQEAVFDSLLIKLEKAIQQTGISRVSAGGGVIANHYLRKKLRALVKKYNGKVYFPPFKYLTGDNAAMIGVVASYKADKEMFVTDIESLDRQPRMSLS